MIKRLAAAVLIAWALGFALFAVFLPQPAPLAQSDGAVVLTGGAKRIDRGLETIESGNTERLLISGVDRDVRPSELAAEYGRSTMDFERTIDLGFQSVDTRSNALETARWVERNNVKSLRLITHDWHMRRARLELDQTVDSDVKIINDAVMTSPSLSVLFREYNKFWLRWIAALLGI